MPVFREHVASRQKDRATTLKNERLYREEFDKRLKVEYESPKGKSKGKDKKGKDKKGADGHAAGTRGAGSTDI